MHTGKQVSHFTTAVEQIIGSQGTNRIMLRSSLIPGERGMLMAEPKRNRIQAQSYVVRANASKQFMYDMDDS